jgi:purine-binding chemotaxis protein CheW
MLDICMTTLQSAPSPRVLTVRLGHCACAVPLSYIREVMRPLPVEPLAGAPAGVLGVAVIRGRATPVVDLEALLVDGITTWTNSARFVTLRIGDRAVALLVEAVRSIRTLAGGELESLPPLWQGSHPPAVSALGAVDHELLFVLEAARLLPDDWHPAGCAGGAR